MCEECRKLANEIVRLRLRQRTRIIGCRPVRVDIPTGLTCLLAQLTREPNFYFTFARYKNIVANNQNTVGLQNSCWMHRCSVSLSSRLCISTLYVWFLRWFVSHQFLSAVFCSILAWIVFFEIFARLFGEKKNLWINLVMLSVVTIASIEQ